MREFNTKVADGGYSITFETDDRKAYEQVQSLCRLLVDGKDGEAIPVEWIKSKKIEYEHDKYDYCKGCFDGFNDCIDYLIEDWERENDQNKENTSQTD